MLTASTKLTICLKIGCPTNFISVFLLMLYDVWSKTKIQHEGETSGEYPSLYYFSRTVVIVYKEDKYFVSKCLNVDVSGFGNTLQEAIDNLNEALQLYFDDKKASQIFLNINETMAKYI